MEEIKADLKAMQADVRDIKHTMRDNTFQLGQNTAQLEIHIQGVKDLQARVKPLEDQALFTRKLQVLITWIFGIAASCAAIAKLFL